MTEGNKDSAGGIKGDPHCGSFELSSSTSDMYMGDDALVLTPPSVIHFLHRGRKSTSSKMMKLQYMRYMKEYITGI
jgi:hypothetical protein